MGVEGCGRLSVTYTMVSWTLCVQVGWFVGGGDECKLGVDGWWKCECVGRQKCLCGSCLIRLTSMLFRIRFYFNESVMLFAT